MLTKESKIRVIESFFSIDYTFFGKRINEFDTSCPVCEEYVKEYVSSKGALMSVVKEIFELLNHSPEKVDKISESEMLINAKKSAKMVRINSANIVRGEKGRDFIKESIKVKVKSGEVKEDDIPELVESEIKRKAFSVSLDNMLIARTISESDTENVKKMDGWNGRILEDAYKILRDDLVDAAIDVLSTIKQ